MRFLLLLGVLLSLPLTAQQTAPAVTREDLPPSSIFSDELNFLDRVRSDMANWSDVELAAFQATTAKAKADCERIERTPHEGEEALALARLCALGWDWDGTYSAAKWYTRQSAPAGEAQHLAMGFAMLLKADLNLQHFPYALDDLAEMRDRIPFDDDADTIYAFSISTFEVMRPEDGIAVAMLRQPALLEAVAGKNKSVLPGRAEAEAWHALGMLHWAGKTQEEATQKAALLAAVAARTAAPAATDLYAAQRGRAAYEWLGKAAPELAVARSTYAHRAGVAAPRSTMWVVESADAADVPALSFAVDAFRAHAAPGTDAKLVLVGAPPAPVPGKRPVHAEYTRDALLDTFGADFGPLLVLLDASGRVAWMGTGTAAWLNPQQQAEVLLSRVAAK